MTETKPDLANRFINELTARRQIYRIEVGSDIPLGMS